MDGWREVQDLSLYSRLYVNENSRMAMATIRYLDRGNSDTKTFQLQNTAEFPAIPSQYRPKQLVYSIADNQAITKLWMSTGGVLSARYSTAGTYTLDAVLIWGY